MAERGTLLLLGKRIKVYVDKICSLTTAYFSASSVCFGSFFEDGEKHKVFLLGMSSSEKTTVRAKVIAMAQTADETLYIAAPFGRIYYEPYLRRLLDTLLKTDYQLTCHFEKSCGAVIYRRKSGNIEYLLIKNKRGTNWGFPKGHVELGESETETAVREVKEETGLNIKPVEGFRVVNEYHPHGNVSKRVVLFLAELTADEEIVIQQSEVERFIWADFSLAQHTFKFNNDRYVLTCARDWINGNRT